VSGTGLTVVAMLVGAVVYLALAYWAGVALVPEA
jgi:ABC-type multidrug transport system permease subunit